MPEIRVKHVVACSSEDRNNPAENLLKSEGTHKWRTATAGEKNATVVLQFEKASQIHSVDIGNEGSAFVEVLVAKSTSSLDYQVLLVSSSFMSPADSRNGTNRNTVRIFGPDKLSKTVALEKWDRVKIVCTQPFNKTSTYGLSFIKFHSPPDSNKPTENEGVKRLGAFVVKNEDEEDDDIKVGSLFSNRGQMDATPVTPKGAAAVRAASRVAEETRATILRARGSNSSASGSQSSPKEPAAAKQSTPKTPAKASPSKGRKKHIMSDEGSDTEEETITPPKSSLKRMSTSVSSHSPEAPPPLKKTKTEPPKSSPEKEFGKLMDKVVFVLSGFQNPYRAELREKALEMGAQYRPDWGRGCTHLVCAFTNTPKYNQVKGRGHIVDKAWILDCYKKKKLLPWRSYNMGDDESPEGSSDDEAIPSKAMPKRTSSSSSSRGSSSTTPQSTATTKKTSHSNESAGDLYGGDTDSPDDTDEEIRRAKVKVAGQNAKEAKVKAKQEEEVKAKRLPVKDRDASEVKRGEKVDATLQLYADSTDEDEPNLFSCSTLAVDDDSEQEQGPASTATSSAANHRTLASTVPVDDEDESAATAATVSVDDDDSKLATSDTVPVEEDVAEDSKKCKAFVSVKEESDESDSGLPDLPDFFENMHFFLYGNFDPQERRLLARYIAAYNGVLEDYMNKRVKFIITCERWDDNFEEALSENPELVFVKPQWIYACHEKNKLIPHQLFVVVP